MRFAIIAAAAAIVAASAAGIVTRGAQAGRPAGTEAAPLTGPDIGTGEKLLLVVAGEHATRARAAEAVEAFAFGDLQGFVVAPSANFDGLAPGRWLVLSAFRTLRGAAAFESLARAAGASRLKRIVAVYRGDAWIGLGQEENPDGTGPLTGPLAPGHPDRL